ncbi:MAG: TonB-dependent receptor, partial [Acidobacteria bacterium]|nr:TonB-dependent receptor [Acidobacteriota bacterium]
YNFTQLPIGSYEVQAEMAGFQSVVRSGIELTVGRQAVVDLTLAVGAVTERIVVTGEAPLVESQSAAISNLVESQTVRDLPLNGRSFDQLIALTAGAVNVRSAGGSTSSGLAAVYSVGGARTNSNKYMVDGTELFGVGQNTSNPGSVSGENLGVEALAEFRVLTNNYGAEYGKKAGGTINVVTKSGTNSFHGSLFAFHRNDNLDARNFFDRDPEHPLTRTNPPEFKRNNFGASAGGPIIRDRLFIFGNYEGLRERLGSTGIATVPDENAHKGYVPDPAVPGGLRFVGIDSRTKPYLDLYPLPNAGNLGGGTGRFIGPGNQSTRQDFWTTRTDYQLRSADSLSGIYRFDDANRTSIRGSNPNFFAPQTTRQHLVTINETHLFSPTVLNVFRAGFARWAGVIDDWVPKKEGVPPFAPHLARMGQLQTTGIDAFGSARVFSIFIANTFEWEDQVSITRSGHGMRIGAQMQRIQQNVDAPTLRFGRYDFSGLETLLTGNPRLFTGPPPDGLSAKGFRRTFLAAYFQDDWAVTPKLTLNLGLRYETMTSPFEVNGNVSNWNETSVNGYRVVLDPPVFRNPPFDNNSKTGFAPRFGFAWRPLASEKTVIRGGGGVFYDQLLDFYIFSLSNTPPFRVVSITNPLFQNPFAGAAGVEAPLQVQGTTRDLDVPTRIQFNLQVQQELSDSMVFSVGYVGASSYHLTRTINANTCFPSAFVDGRPSFNAGCAARNPNLASTGRYVISDGTGKYNSLQIDLRSRLIGGLRFQTAYTWSKSLDDASSHSPGEGGGEAGSANDPDAPPRAERGLSLYDTKHNFSTNFSYELPFGKNLSGFASKLLGGWQMNGILALQSGLPVTVKNGRGIIAPRNKDEQGNDRPDLAAGASNNPSSGTSVGCGSIPQGTKLGTPDLYYDPCAFVIQTPGFFGSLGRNTVVGPGLANVDFSLFKNTPLREGLNLQFRAEMFNLLNRPNFSLPNADLFRNIAGSRRGDAGQITGTSTTSRQIQFGLKLLW